MKDRCFEPRDGVADGPEVAIPVFDEEPSARSTRGVSRTNFRNCWLFIRELVLASMRVLKRLGVCLFRSTVTACAKKRLYAKTSKLAIVLSQLPYTIGQIPCNQTTRHMSLSYLGNYLCIYR